MPKKSQGRGEEGDGRRGSGQGGCVQRIEVIVYKKKVGVGGGGWMCTKKELKLL